MSSNAAPGLRQDKTCCVSVDVQHHAAGMAADHGIWAGCGVIEELGALVNGQGGGTSLLRGDFIQGREHGWVDCLGAAEKCSICSLNACDAGFIEDG